MFISQMAKPYQDAFPYPKESGERRTQSQKRCSVDSTSGLYQPEIQEAQSRDHI